MKVCGKCVHCYRNSFMPTGKYICSITAVMIKSFQFCKSVYLSKDASNCPYFLKKKEKKTG